MTHKLIPLLLVVGVLCACDGGNPPKAVSVTDNATNSLASTHKSPLPTAASVASNATDISAIFPVAYASLPKKAGGACGFDQPKTDGDNQFVSGWAAISAKDGVLAEAIVIGVSDNGSEKFAMVSKQKREEVAKYFNSPALVDSGFSVYIRKSDIPSGSKAILYQVFQGSVYACEVTAAI